MGKVWEREKQRSSDGIRKEGQTLLYSCGDFELQNTDVSPLLPSIRQRGGVTGQGAACQDGLELVDTVVRARASWCPPQSTSRTRHPHSQLGRARRSDIRMPHGAGGALRCPSNTWTGSRTQVSLRPLGN